MSVATARCRSAIAMAVLLPVTSAPILSSQPSPTAIVDRIRSTDGKPIDFHAAAFPESVYVGQQVTYQVAVLLSDQARSRLRRNPEFLPPELRGLLAYELGTPRRVPARSYGGGVAYEAHVFQRALFGVAAGTLKVPAPQLTYSLPQSSSYFSREERFVVRAESAQLVIRPLPEEGRPSDFTGAVGVLRASTRFDGADVRVGDPLVLTIRIEGTGNVKLLPRPALELSWASVVPGSERVQVDTTGALVRGAKEFDFILTPNQSGAVTLPVVRYAYFDPYRRAYANAESAPADVRVADGNLAAGAEAPESDALPLRTWQHRETRSVAEWAPLWRILGLVLLLLAPVPALVTLVARVRRQRAAQRPDVPRASAREEAIDDDSPAGMARRTRRTMLAELAFRLHVKATDLVTPADVERVLRRRGVTRATTRDVMLLLDELATQGFAGPSGTNQDRPLAHQRAEPLLAKVNGEAVTHGRARLWSRRARQSSALLPVLLVGLAMSGPLHTLHAAPLAVVDTTATCQSESAEASSGLAVLVEEGMAAYRAGRFTTAAQRMGTAVAICPRDADLLLNWGNAAWAASDTVSAVMAWQRAARLDPLAADAQERLALLPAGARGGFAEVPMVPVTALVIAGAVAWLVGWVLFLVAWRDPNGSGTVSLVATLLLAAALAAGGTAWWGHRALSSSGLAVVRRPETLRSAPGFDANTAGGLSTGDLVRMSSMQEGWFRIEHIDGRSGWVPASRLAPLVGGTATR
ncbi:SH3 domain-containing protein [Gemmatimonas phototrophica]|uniref:SH3 domain-containing protein n=1 Tax=Gemmatimonas phototrophica TaxID=1379270 RepID=UPI00047D06A6|nr:SH3 domain-containing protein [Gemmatimonas phototrophica]